MIRPEDRHQPGSVADHLLASLRTGINLQGWTLWSEPVFSAGEMRLLRADGFDHVRIYFDARASGGDRAAYPADLGRDWVIQKAEQTIANALAAGLAVVVSPTPTILPTDSAATIDAHVAFLGAFAGRIAARFGTDRVIIETTNEPAFASQAAWQAVEARLIGAVRAAAPELAVMTAANQISGGEWWSLGGVIDTVPYRQGNLLYSAHSYFPHVFTTQEYGLAHWPATPALAASPPTGTHAWFYREGLGTEAALKAEIDAHARVADARGMTLQLGEFGVIATAPGASRLAYLAAATEALEKHGLGWTAWQTHGTAGLYTRAAQGLLPLDPALRSALGLSGPRPDEPLSVTFTAGSPHDLWAPWTGVSLGPVPGSAVVFGPAQLGAAALRAEARVSLSRDGSGAVTAASLGPWLSVSAIGIEDDGPGRVATSGFERSWVSLGNGGSSVVSSEAFEHRVVTGNGADHVRLTAFSPATAAVGGGGFVSTGAGDDLIEIGVRRTAANTGAVTARYEVWAGAGDDRIVIGGGVHGLFSGGSGDDWIVSGAGDEDLRGDAGIDTVELPGARGAWRFTPKQDEAGLYLEAIGPGGADRLRGVEWVVFGDGAVARFGELGGNRAPGAPALVTTGLAPGVLARATAADPEGGALTWFLSDTAGKRFAIDPFSGEVTLRPGASVAAGQRYDLGVAVVDDAGNVVGATLALTIPAITPPVPGSASAAAFVTLSNAMLAGHGGPSWSAAVAKGSARIVTGAELALPGVAADARVSLAADAAGAVSVSVLSGWNSVKTVSLLDLDGGTVSVANAVNAELSATGTRPATITVTDAKRGKITTGSGDDVITVRAVANTPDHALFTLDGGAGNDRITLTSASAWTRAVIDGGDGDDVITGGPGDDVIRGGAGFDTAVLPGLRRDTRFTAGVSAEGPYVIAEGPGGMDLLRGIELVRFADGTTWRAGELVGNRAPTEITLAEGSRPGMLAVARATDPDDLAGFSWALRGAAASRFAIDAGTGEITALPGTSLQPGAAERLDLAVTDPWGNVVEAAATLRLGGAAGVTLSNATAPDLSPLYAPGWTGAATGARMLTAADLAALGAGPDARVRVAADAAGAIEVAVLSAWNSVKNVLVEDGDGGKVRIDNAVHAGFHGTGAAATSLTVTGAKRADLRTGSGNDTITVSAFSNMGGDGNRIVVDAGAGNDRVTVSGHSSWTTAQLIGGAGDDVLVFSGGGAAVLDGGTGADTMRGGAGRDRFILRPGEVEGDRIEGFAGAGAAGGDWLVMQGFGAGASLTHQGGDVWRVSYVAGGVAASERFTLVGVGLLGADDVIWA